MLTFLCCRKPSKRAKYKWWRSFLEKYILNKCHVSNFLWADQIISTSLRSHLWESKSSYRSWRNPRKAVPQRSSWDHLPNPHPKILYRNEIYQHQLTQNLNTKDRMNSRTKASHATHGWQFWEFINWSFAEDFLWTLQSVFF